MRATCRSRCRQVWLCALGAEEFKERSKRIPGPPFAAPDEGAGSQIIDIGEIHMTLLPGNLINADVGDVAQIPVGKAEGNHIGDGSCNGAPGALKMPGNLEPR